MEERVYRRANPIALKRRREEVADLLLIEGYTVEEIAEC